jgi:hypothetical protein
VLSDLQRICGGKSSRCAQIVFQIGPEEWAHVYVH